MDDKNRWIIFKILNKTATNLILLLKQTPTSKKKSHQNKQPKDIFRNIEKDFPATIT